MDCDFAKAHRGVPQMIEQLQLTVVAQWCPQEKKVVSIVSAGQLFGGKTPPRNFSRCPAWWCYLMAPMYGLPLQHTVDDVMATERCSVVESGNHVWRKPQKLLVGIFPIPNRHNLQVKHVCLALVSGTTNTAPSLILPRQELIHSNNFCLAI